MKLTQLGTHTCVRSSPLLASVVRRYGHDEAARLSVLQERQRGVAQEGQVVVVAQRGRVQRIGQQRRDQAAPQQQRRKQQLQDWGCPTAKPPSAKPRLVRSSALLLVSAF